MYAVATFLIVAVITLVFGKLATGALIATGLPPDIAAFQSRSAFSGAGFTTTEAENVINHPARRRIIMTTMFVGSLGTPTLIVTVLFSMVAPGPGSTNERALVLLSGMVLILLAVLNRPMTNLLVGVGQKYATKRLLPALAAEPTVLLNLGTNFEIDILQLTADPKEAVRGLRGLDQAFKGVTVLGIRRGKEYFGEAPVDITLKAGDELIVYGRHDRLAEIRRDSEAPGYQ